MYELNDTIIAVSSPSLGERSIVRISGPDTLAVLQQVFDTPIVGGRKGGVIAGNLAVDVELQIEAQLYLFLAPHSYTGETVAEIHIYANPSITEVLLEGLLNRGLRMAGPGEFTARAYLNGKVDLTQAEAVNEIVTSSNRFQLAAAEKLLGGSLSETTVKIRSELMECLSLIEAGLDFSGEDIELETGLEMARRLSVVKSELEQLLSGSINCESTLDLPAVGIAGAPGAGKSSLLNKLAGYERSIVSASRKTTRDVLTSLLTLEHCRCVLFDCAGLMQQPHSILDELAQQVAIKSLQNSSVVVFCVDISKTDWAEDVLVCELIENKVLIPVSTKSDLLCGELLTKRLAELRELFGLDFIVTSAKNGTGVERLKNVLEEKIIELSLGSDKRGMRYEGRDASLIALTARHRQAVTEAIKDIGEAMSELKAGNDEIAAMMLRLAYRGISDIEQRHIDEEVLERIFSRFCIGK